MSTSTIAAATTRLDPAIASRIIREGYGPGAWHGPDLAAALSNVSAADAYRRPARGRHNIAEIALHHAYYVRAVIERLGGKPDDFPLAGEDWFPLNDESEIQWSAIMTLLESLQAQLAAQVIEPPQNGRSADEQMDLVLGITCHAVYHAGQIQLIKVLALS